MNLIENILTSKKNNPILRNNKYKIGKVKAIILHTTGVLKPHKAETVRDNFNKPNARYASAHFIVKEDLVIKCISEQNMAYHVGSSWKNYTDLAHDIMEEYTTPNKNTLGIEIIIYKGSDIEKTLDTTYELCANLLMKYNLWISDIHFHRHITGKKCPVWETGEAMSDDDLEMIRNQVELKFWDIQNVIL